MSISRTPLGERPITDGGESVAKTKGPPDRRQMKASKELPLVPEAR